ncbi:hypothetical protein PPTG_17970 [Phytophthora nicotianae INRA-310]|uniref:Nucleoside phosphorylase domain-containing protein n=1 Tax=Phytophthora nicotianae (strain INRA-310) TaxID=761204 RepID=W2PKF1_PHYN3|nr:hypothetical protein PPTG_17970 [Phytophthora nicotianae INRA-310]ETN00520.1 hypothetical protein PPTG_17970 [Phytophthora nicotianae INRA-310]
MIPRTHVLGVIGGSSLFHAKSFSSNLVEQVVETEFGAVVCHIGTWPSRSQDDTTPALQLVFVQRHHADPDGKYRQPRKINFRAIALALKSLGCEAVVGIYSVGSMTPKVGVGRFVVPEAFSAHLTSCMCPTTTTHTWFLSSTRSSRPRWCRLSQVAILIRTTGASTCKRQARASRPSQRCASSHNSASSSA